MGEQLWLQCSEWLNQLDVLPPGHRLSQLKDLAYTLRDGVVLCHISATLDPSSIDLNQMHQRPQTAKCLCLKNIRVFLHSCRNSFGMKESDLFEPSMLFDYADFGRVMYTLSKFSRCPKVRKLSSIGGFPTFSHPKTLPEEEEQIYQRLEDLVNDDDTYEEFYYSHHGGGITNYLYCNVPVGGSGVASSREPVYSPSSRDEDIYSDLCDLRGKAAAVQGSGSKESSSSASSSTVTAPFVSRIGLLQAEWKFEPKNRSDFCLQELVETEANYVDCLNMLRKNFIKPIRKMKEADRKVVFINIKGLGETHGAFYTSLVECVTKKSHKKLGDVFMEFKERFLMYADYCTRLPAAQERLSQLYQKDEEIRKEITECEESANDGRFRLRDLLSVPMQRILKYHLLLGQLVKSGSPSRSGENRHLASAHEAMLDVADYINEVKRDSEHLQVIQEIQSSITDGFELKGCGRMRKDGELKVQSHDSLSGGIGKPKLRYMFVFDKVLLTCKTARGDQYSYKDSLKLSDYRVQDLDSGGSGSVSGASNASNSMAHRLSSSSTATSRLSVMRRDSTRWSHSFLLVHADQLNAFTFYARTADDKKKWIEAISEALTTVTPMQLMLTSTHHLQMHSFEKPTSCSACQKYLKGLFYQGYQCTTCSAAVHRQCIPLLPSCGMLFPPELPPRPTAESSNADNTLSSTISTEDEESPDHHRQTSLALLLPTFNSSSSHLNDDRSSLPIGTDRDISSPGSPPFKQTAETLHFSSSVPPGHNPDYINTRMEEHCWYVGEMDREGAVKALSRFPPCTFLIRRRVVDGQTVGYALSLKVEDEVKHMKIYSSIESPKRTTPHSQVASSLGNVTGGCGSDLFYLSESRKFKSVVELVQWYSRNSLKESFTCLDTTLRFAIGELTVAEARYEFVPRSDNMLPLRVGGQLTIIDKSSGSKGWWKACNGHQVGYIPKEFVMEIN